MEGNETHTICRLCLGESDNFVYVFESKGIHGWTAADGITELLRIQVSADDIYPKCVCIVCMEKLEDFKLFKDRCENSKELLDRANVRKRGIGRHEESIGETLNCEGNHSVFRLKEEDLNIELEKDPLDLTEDGKPIKSEIEDIVISNEMTPNEAIESASDPCFPDKNEDEDPVMALEADTNHLPSNLSLTESDCIETIPVESELSPPCTITGDSLIASKGEMEFQEEEERDPLGDLNDVKPSVSQLNGAFSGVTELCGEGSNHEFAGGIVTSSRVQGSVDIDEVKEECCSPSGGHDLDVSTAELRSTDKGNNDPLDTTSLTFTLKREECEVRLSDTSSHNKPRESARKNDTEQDIASCVQSDVGERGNRTSDLRALRPRTHMSRKEVNDAGGNAENGGQVEEEMRTGGTLQHNLEGTDNRFMCYSCGMYFAAKSNLRKHIESHFGEQMSKSEVYSGKELVDRDSLVCANESVDGKSVVNLKSISLCTEWTCIVCQKVFKGDGHLRLRAGETIFKCDECGTGFNHRKKQIPPSKILSGDTCKCEECGKELANKDNLNRHLEIHAEERPFKCDLCNKRFKHKKNQIRHSKIHSGDTYKCEQCGKVFITKSYLNQHVRLHTRERTFKCDICHKRFKQRKYLRVHSKIHSSDNPYECNECGIGFTEIARLKRHVRIHTVGRPFKCDLCNKEFTRKSMLTAHYKLHRDDTYKCEDCGKEFASKRYLKDHLLVHTGERPFKCHICHKQFTQREHLVLHCLIHSSDKPYKCNECGLCFIDMARLKRHLQIHSGEKPFKCDTCNKGFTHKRYLRDHSEIHSGQTFSCEQCGMGFIRKSYLNIHIQIHTRERPFKCEICHKRFNHRRYLRAHSKIHSRDRPQSCKIYWK